MEGLSLDGVWFTYDGRRWVLKRVSLVLEPCKAIYVTGPNGAGKTTLMRIAGLVARPTRGRVLVDGVDYWAERSLAVRRKVVYVPSTPLLVRGSLLDNVALGLELRGVEREAALETAARLLEEYGLGWMARVRRDEASSGQAQLAHVLRGVVTGAEYLVLDEPTAYLDAEKKKMLADILRERLSACTAVIAAGHDLEFAGLLKAEVYELREGVIVRRGASSSQL